MNKRCKACGKELEYADEIIQDRFCSYKCVHIWNNYHHNYYAGLKVIEK